MYFYNSQMRQFDITDSVLIITFKWYSTSCYNSSKQNTTLLMTALHAR